MIHLIYMRDGKKKFYELELEEGHGRLLVNAFYGRIGGIGRSITLYDGVNRKAAEDALHRKKQEKLKSGYIEISAGASKRLLTEDDFDWEAEEERRQQQGQEEEEEEFRRLQEEEKKHSEGK